MKEYLKNKIDMFQNWVFDTFSHVIVEVTDNTEGIYNGKTYEYTCDDTICFIAETASDDRVYMIYIESIETPERIIDNSAQPGKPDKGKWKRRR